MRLTLVILGLTVIALALVHIRREELAVRHDMQRLESRYAEARRALWSRQVEIGHLTAPRAVRYRAEVMALELTHELPSYVTRTSCPRAPRPLRSSMQDAARVASIRAGRMPALRQNSEGR